MGGTTDLDLTAPLPTLLQQLIDIPSESRHEQVIADAVHDALRGCDHLVLDRIGHNIVARTQLGRAERVVIGGHVDTVPENRNMPSSRAIVDGQDRVMGLGACDMKGGVAVLLQLAATLREPTRDVTWVLYEAEEIDARFNGLRLLAEQRPELLESSFAVLMEPSNAVVEAGCQGTMRVEVRTTGVRSHSARSWMGHNAIHDAVDVLARLRDYEPRQVEIDGLTYREGLNAVRIRGGVAGNVIPDLCEIEVNYRFAPSRSTEDAERHVRDVFAGFEVDVIDVAAGARPGLDASLAQEFVAAVGAEARPKYGWTDVARFSAMSVPAVNYGPGDPHLAHHDQERVPLAQIVDVERGLRAWLSAP